MDDESFGGNVLEVGAIEVKRIVDTQRISDGALICLESLPVESSISCEQ